MKRIHMSLSRTAIALLVSLGATTPTLAAQCNDVIFSLRNMMGFDVEINRVRYRDLDAANAATRWVENVPNETCNIGQTCALDPQNLGSVTRPRRNHELTEIQFEYRRLGGNWAWSTPMGIPSNMTCTNGRTYGAFEIN